ncbi:putative transposase (fragment) [Streptococcus pneumoniae SPNA45]
MISSTLKIHPNSLYR